MTSDDDYNGLYKPWVRPYVYTNYSGPVGDSNDENRYNYSFCFMHFRDDYDGGYNDSGVAGTDINKKGWGTGTFGSHSDADPVYRYNGYFMPQYISNQSTDHIISYGTIDSNISLENVWLIAGEAGWRGKNGYGSQVLGGVLNVWEIKEQ